MAHSQESHSLFNSLSNKPLQTQEPLEIGDQYEDSFSYAMLVASASAFSMAMQTALELGVFDIIHRAGPNARISAEEIASELSCRNPEAPSALDRLLRLLVDHSVLHCSIVTGENQERCFRQLYGLTPLAKFFLRNVHGGSLGPLLLLIQCQHHLNSWSHLKDSILNGGTAYKRANGCDFYDPTNLDSDSSFGPIFHEAMVNYTIILVNKILECYKGFGDITSLVDVGGGLGITLNLITSKYPHIHGINFDLPNVLHSAPHYPGVEHVGGDMFESVPKGDAIFIKWILQDWSDEQCVKLLKNCYDAIPENGKVILVHAVLDTEPDTSATTKINNQFEVILMAYTGGRERSKPEYLKLATSAGFRGIRFECLVCSVWVMELFK